MRSQCGEGTSGRDLERRRVGLEKVGKQEMGYRKRWRGKRKCTCTSDAAWLDMGARAGVQGVAELLSKQDMGCEMRVGSCWVETE